MENIQLDQWEYDFIMTLPKFDLAMLISDVSDHGWPIARTTLKVMHEVAIKRPKAFYSDRPGESTKRS